MLGYQQSISSRKDTILAEPKTKDGDFSPSIKAYVFDKIDFTINGVRVSMSRND